MESMKTKTEKKEKNDDSTVLTREKSSKNVPPPPYIPAEISASNTDFDSKSREDIINLNNMKNLTIDEKDENCEVKNREKNPNNGKIVEKEVEGKSESEDESESESDKGKFVSNNGTIDDYFILLLLLLLSILYHYFYCS
jgi:hypothetical protein